MKYILFVVVLSGCGYRSIDNEIMGQPKKVVHQNPILCDARYDVDISLGVMRDGVGSMSVHDEWLTVERSEDVELLKKATETGNLVKITYSTKRFTWCWFTDIISKVELVK